MGLSRLSPTEWLLYSSDVHCMVSSPMIENAQYNQIMNVHSISRFPFMLDTIE